MAPWGRGKVGSGFKTLSAAREGALRAFFGFPHVFVEVLGGFCAAFSMHFGGVFCEFWVIFVQKWPVFDQFRPFFDEFLTILTGF